MKTLIVAITRTGNNKAVADFVKKKTKADYEVVKMPSDLIVGTFGCIVGTTNKPKLKHDPNKYDTIILCSPMYFGRIPPKLRGFLKKYKHKNMKIICLSGTGNNPKGVHQIKNIKDVPVLQIGLATKENHNPENIMKLGISEVEVEKLFKEKILTFLES